MNRLHLVFFLLASLCACATPDLARNVPEGSKVISAEESNSPVTLQLYHEEQLPIGPGFSVYISGWEPNDSVEVFAYDKNGAQVAIVAGGKTLPVSPDGKVSFSVPYAFHAFRPGQWLIVVSGKSGQHGHYVDIPKPSGK